MTNTEEKELRKFVKIRNNKWEEYEQGKREILLRVKLCSEYAIELDALIERLHLSRRRQRMGVHFLKTDPGPFQAALDGKKTFEVRFDDRCFEVGDTLVLKETKYSGVEMRTGAELKYTGRNLSVAIMYKLDGGYGLEKGWCALSFRKLIRDIAKGGYE